jgi:hypothetical protein
MLLSCDGSPRHVEGNIVGDVVEHHQHPDGLIDRAVADQSALQVGRVFACAVALVATVANAASTVARSSEVESNALGLSENRLSAATLWRSISSRNPIAPRTGVSARIRSAVPVGGGEPHGAPLLPPTGRSRVDYFAFAGLVIEGLVAIAAADGDLARLGPLGHRDA